MAIIRIHKAERYSVTINRYGLEDPRLSFKAKGLLAYLMTKPDDWTVNSRHLAAVGPDKRDAILNAFDELGECGYFTRKKTKNKEGKWEWEQVLHDTPHKARATSYHGWKRRIRKTPPISKDKTLSSKERSSKKRLSSVCRTCGVPRGASGCWCEKATG